jgi:pimeloyl-ACP methyl ester carboxylesterase
MSQSSAGIVHIPTQDGAQIACKRRPASGQPVVLLHGLAVNADVWDCPEIRGDNFMFRSLPGFLNEADYDVWLVNLRGHGAPHMLSAPAPGQTDWCVDHFILYDLPAVIDHVARSTGRKPFLIGNSMGAMTIAGCMQGATLVGYGQSQAIVADEACARRRQADVAGCVLVEFPAALRWPKSFYTESSGAGFAELLRELQNPDAGSNYPFELMARWPWIETLLSATGSVRLDWLRPRGAPPPADEMAPRPDFVARIKAAAMRWYSERFKAAENFQIETFTNGLLRAADHMKAGVLRQMGKCVRSGSFVSALGTPDHV